MDLGLLVGARGREAQQRQAVAVEDAILHPVAFGLAGSLFVELVAVGLDSQDGLLAHPVVNQEVEVRGAVRGVAAFLVIEKRPVADQLSQRLVAENAQMPKCRVGLQHPLQQGIGQILGVELRDPAVPLEELPTGFGVGFVEQVENRMDGALRDLAAVVVDVGQQIGNVAAVGLLVARSDERELPFGPRYGDVQQIGIVCEGGNLIVDGRQDDGLLLPSLELVDRGHVNTSAQLAVERIDLLVVGGDNADFSLLAGE